VLKPLHESLFSFLKSLPNDGTFDQTASVKRGSVKSIEASCSFGYDLSAATDRLPMFLQEAILESIFGPRLSKPWKRLLVDRDYVLFQKDDAPVVVRYAVGQPMGALSS
jgi:hypothetical protein